METRYKIILLLALIISTLSGCNCGGETLNSVCPVDEQLGKACVSNVDGTWRELSPNEKGTWNVGDDSQCKIGYTACNTTTLEITCEGFHGALEEICGDNLDNDCDFKVDEGFDRDRDGVKTCEGDCNDFNSQVNPFIAEICDGLDNNCDGLSDNIVPQSCWTGPDNVIVNEPHVPCYTGITECVNGVWTPCANEQHPEPEQCDGIDNDCNGEIDENTITEDRECGPPTEVGICSYGHEVCIDGEPFCVDAVYEQNEECNAADDDCDTKIDEDLIRVCSTDCGEGVEYCQAGNWIGCTAAQPVQEICDGLDNDCDGEVDEDCLCVNGTAQECIDNMIDQDGNPVYCGLGVQFCQDGEWGICYFYGLISEACNDHDDDCDGIVDQIKAECGESEVGKCTLDEIECIHGEWEECEAVLPQDEECNGEDDDCDGEVDNGLEPNDKVDMVFVIDNSGSMCNKINALELGISNYVDIFQDTPHQFGLVVFPASTNIPVQVYTSPALTNVVGFIAALSTVDCSGPIIEPSYDALDLVTEENDPLNIGWREDATPYVILITDEGGQGSATESHVTNQMNNCAIGNCSGSDKIESFAIASNVNFSDFDSITYYESDRLVDINPVDANRYTEVLEDIFKDVCFYELDAGMP